MLALVDFEPRYCPNCGGPELDQKRPYELLQFKLRAARSCPCGVVMQKVSTQMILVTSKKSEGDLFEKSQQSDSLNDNSVPPK
jgi:hypothetical protein